MVGELEYQETYFGVLIRNWGVAGAGTTRLCVPTPYGVTVGVSVLGLVCIRVRQNFPHNNVLRLPLLLLNIFKINILIHNCCADAGKGCGCQPLWPFFLCANSLKFVACDSLRVGRFEFHGNAPP